MLKIREELFSKVESECPECNEQNICYSNKPMCCTIITQKCDVCGHEYKIAVL